MNKKNQKPEATFANKEEMIEFVKRIKGLKGNFPLDEKIRNELIRLNLSKKTLQMLLQQYHRECAYDGPQGGEPNAVRKFILALELGAKLGVRQDVLEFKLEYNQVLGFSRDEKSLAEYKEKRAKQNAKK